MVRLKYMAYRADVDQLQVSIPNGSIKIRSGVKMDCLTSVSIPNGSIKIVIKPVWAALVIMFQFQMVRLKYKKKKSNQAKKKVSIPNGSIKIILSPRLKFVSEIVSIPNGSIKIRPFSVTLLATLAFQFQMVRLKCFTMNELNIGPGFQFQMVRLKWHLDT